MKDQHMMKNNWTFANFLEIRPYASTAQCIIWEVAARVRSRATGLSKYRDGDPANCFVNGMITAFNFGVGDPEKPKGIWGTMYNPRDPGNPNWHDPAFKETRTFKDFKMMVEGHYRKLHKSDRY